MSAFVVTMADVVRCPVQVLSARHYRQDGSCYHFGADGSGPIAAHGKKALAALRLVRQAEQIAVQARANLDAIVAGLSEAELAAYEALAAETPSPDARLERTT